MADDNARQVIFDSCLDESSKIIRYLEEQEAQQKPYRLAMFIFAVISAVCGLIAAITGLIMCLQ